MIGAYLYVQIQDWALYHHGNPVTSNYQLYNCVEKNFDLSICNKLLPVFGPAPLPLPYAQSSTPPMLSVAMESYLDEQNSTKVSVVARDS